MPHVMPRKYMGMKPPYSQLTGAIGQKSRIPTSVILFTDACAALLLLSVFNRASKEFAADFSGQQLTFSDKASI
jgi:hypothetical protein